MIAYDPTVEIYWEWPRNCRGWKESIIEELFNEIGQTWDCRIDGCRYGLKTASGNLVLKPWMIRTSSLYFYSEFRNKTCVGNHTHEWLHGVETNKSAFYPPALCRAIARNFRSQLLPYRWSKLLWMSAADDGATFEGFVAEHYNAPGELCAGEEQPSGEDQQPDGEDQPPSEDALRKWEVQLNQFHRAAGHPSTRNLVRMLVDAQVEPWKIQQARKFRCSTCEEMVKGGVSSKQIPPAAMRPLPVAWEQVGIDLAEWTVPNQNTKVKFVMMIDLATRYRITETLFVYAHGENKVETTDMMIKVITTRWLMSMPRPKCLVPDNANTLVSYKITEFMADLGIEIATPPDGESWAHGISERAVGQIKETASLIQQSLPDQDPFLTLAMATSAMNNTEFVKGYTSIQWAFGKQAELDDGELRQQLSLPIDRQQHEFLRLLNQRQLAEECARKAKARTVMSKLKNSAVRQPLRTFKMGQPVYIWRKFLPHSVYAGKKGGHKHVGRPRWVGPGRVVFHELVPGQEEEDRKHVVWVILGTRIYKTSVHSVRPLSAREQHLFEIKGDESHRWKQLSDVLPKREFIDITVEEPAEDEVEQPFLPDEPGSATIVKPQVRFPGKFPIMDSGHPDYLAPPKPGRPVSTVDETFDPVNVYEPDSKDLLEPDNKRFKHDAEEEPGDEYEPTTPAKSPPPSPRRTSVSSTTPLLEPREPAEKRAEAGEGTSDEPESKRLKADEDEESEKEFKFLEALRSVDEGYVFNFELDLESNRKKKDFMRNPVMFLAKKMAGAEVNYKRLSPEEKQLFENAKQSEVSSFLRTEAVRRCLSYEEQQRAENPGRVLKSRWVLVWKGVPEESRAEAADDRKNNPNTTHDASLTRKAKARIVLLGFQHPDLELSTFNTTAPVQSQLMRHLSLITVAQRGWTLEGLDMKTAFLQTGGDSVEAQELWTPGVPELRAALGASDGELLRLLRNVYGSATAPRGLWTDVDQTLQRLGGHRLIGDAAFWCWVEENPNPKNPADRYNLIGFVGGHVDDFNRAGDTTNEKWLSVRQAIDKAYAWGTRKEENFRHSGVDLEVKNDRNERYVQLSQDFYLENLPDLAIPEDRLRGDPKSLLSPGEMAACRASLGALQWACTQTQIQACARVNLLLTELTVDKSVMVAKEIADLIKDVKKDPMNLRLFKLPHVQHWQDWTVVTMADQAHNNRPQGGSTGGLLTCLGGPEQLAGEAGRLNPVSWRTWRLRRKAISTNDGEMQATLEGEDSNFRVRWMWCQLNGCCAIKDGNLLEKANDLVKYVKGLVATDSKGVFDAVNKNEGPLLGLSNARSALQGYQLKEQLSEADTKLIWISGDWNLSDALTKKAKAARLGLMQFAKQFIWKLKYDPHFIQSEKKAKKDGRAAVQQMKELQALVPIAHMIQEEF